MRIEDKKILTLDEIRKAEFPRLFIDEYKDEEVIKDE